MLAKLDILATLCLCCFLAAATTGCASPPVPYVGTQSRDEVIYVITGGWHTELALPMSAISGPLATLKPNFTDSRYLVFGWGAHDYYMASDPGLGDLMRAIIPGPAVLLVVPLKASPEAFAGAANAVAIPVSRAGIERLAHFLWDYLATDTEGVLHPIAGGPYPGSVFYASRGTFDLTHTCNAWTAEALRTAGVRVNSTGVVYAAQLLDQLTPATAEPEPDATQHQQRPQSDDAAKGVGARRFWEPSL